MVGMTLSGVLLTIVTVSAYSHFFSTSHSVFALTLLSNTDHPATMKVVLSGKNTTQTGKMFAACTHFRDSTAESM
jgi:hypothetical protein